MKRSHTALAFGRSNRCTDQLDAGSGYDTFELVVIPAIIVADEETWTFTKRRGFAQLMGYPLVHMSPAFCSAGDVPKEK